MGAGDRTDEEYDAAGSLNSKQKAATDALWAKLNGGGCAGAKGKAKGAEAGSGSSDASAKGRAALDILSKLNRTSAGKVVKPGAKGADASRAADDKNWQRLLGVGSGGKSGAPKAKAPLTEAQLEAARAAISAAGGVIRTKAAVRTEGVVSVKETRNFAGKEMEVVKTYAEGSREAKQAAKRDAAAKGGGLDSVLLQMEKARKLNVLDKSKMDWKEVKEGDAEMEEDLERHKKGKTYLEEQDFLKRAELREYEIERDARLAGDVRTRGRL